MKAKIAVIALGGTIAMTADKAKQGVVPKLTAEDLISAVPLLSQGADIVAENFCMLPSCNLTFDIIHQLADKISTYTDIDGVVITQGTDSIEETSYLLDLLLDTQMPVVVTGAMRNPSRPGADGAANILSAVQVASAASARGMGVLVVLNDKIHAAQCVRKSHTSDPDTFKSDPLGPIGWVAEDQVRIVLKPQKRPSICLSATPKKASVVILKLGIDSDPIHIESFYNAPIDGMVIEALGGGHVPLPLVEPLHKMAQKIPVILSSRTGQGETLAHTYGYPGAEIDLLSKGLIHGGRLNGVQARILLSTLLRHNVTEIGDSFKQYAL